MVLPGSPGLPVELACGPDDLRQLAEHDAQHRTFAGGAGPLAALDTCDHGALGTVLLVAGYTGTKEDFAPLLRPLCEAGYRAVALDQRASPVDSSSAQTVPRAQTRASEPLPAWCSTSVAGSSSVAGRS